MKIAQLILGLYLGCLCGAASAASDEIFVGDIGTKQLLSQFEQFSTSYQDATADPHQLNTLKDITEKITIVGLFGTWCHDSVREVPRMIKLLESVANPNISINLIAVAVDKSGADQKYNLLFTPTFVVYRQGLEIGRIVERPQVSLAADLAQIISQ